MTFIINELARTYIGENFFATKFAVIFRKSLWTVKLIICIYSANDIAMCHGIGCKMTFGHLRSYV